MKEKETDIFGTPKKETDKFGMRAEGRAFLMDKMRKNPLTNLPFDGIIKDTLKG